MAADPRFEYQDISRIGISSAKVKEIMAYIMDSKGVSGYGAVIIGGIKLLVMAAFVFLIERLESREAAIKKQTYERDQDSKNEDQLSKDDLSGETRKSGPQTKQ